jgi:hypothetical protein
VIESQHTVRPKPSNTHGSTIPSSYSAASEPVRLLLVDHDSHCICRALFPPFPTSQPNRPHLPRCPTTSSGNELQEFGVRSVLHQCGSQTACSVSRPVALPNRLAWLVCVVQREGHSSVAQHSGNSPTVLRSAWGLPLCHVGLTTRSMPQTCVRAYVRACV